MKRYTYQVIVAGSQFFNALTGGWADETFSARCYRMSQSSRRWRVVRKVMDIVFYPIDGADHCERAFILELERAHSPKGFYAK